MDAEFLAAPIEIDRDGVARGAGLRRGEQPLLADQPVDQSRLAGIRAPDDGDADRMRARRLGRRFDLRCGVFGQCRAQRVVEIGQALVVLGGNRDRIAEAERVGVEPPAFAGGAFHLVGDQHDRLARLADELCEYAIDAGRTAARIDHEKYRIGLRHGSLSLRAHATGEALGRRFLKSRGIDHGEIKIAEPGLAFAAVARHARAVVDQRHAPADQPVEQSRLADIGAADDGDGEAHGQRSGPRMAGDALLT